MRLAYLWGLRDTPITDVLLIDSETYDRFAQRILDGSYRGEDVYSVNVLYPYFLAAVYAVTKASQFAVLVLQGLLDASSCVMAWWIGRRLFSPAAGLISGLALAVYGPMVFYTGTLLTPTLITFLGLAALALLVRYRLHPDGRVALAAGLVLGLATLARGNNALFVVASLAFFLVAAGTRARALRHWAMLLAGALSLIVLVTVRNYLVEGQWVPVAANYAAFYIGHNPEATGLYTMPSFIESARFESEVWGARAAIAQKLGREVSLAESAQYLFGEGLRYAVTHPLDELRLLGTKLYYFWNRTESPTNLNYYFALDYSALLRRLPLGFGVVAPFGLLGMWFARREWRRHLALHLYVLVALATALLFFVSAEYRLAVVPVLGLFGAHAVVVLARALAGFGRPRGQPVAGRSKRGEQHRAGEPLLSRPLLQAMILLPLLLIACNVRNERLASQSLKRVDYLNFGTLYKERGDLATARSFLERSIAIDSRYRPAYEQLAAIALANGDATEAARLSRIARGLIAPGEAAQRTPADAIADSVLVVAERYRAGDYIVALAGFRRLHARSLAVGNPALSRSLSNNIGLCYYKLGDWAAAETVYDQILLEDSTYVNAHTNLGRVLRSQGRIPEAVARFEHALRLDPQNRSAQTELGRILGGR